MKSTGWLPIWILLTMLVWSIPAAGTPPAVSDKAPPKAAASTAELARRYPIAPGVWYPADGPIPEKLPQRYYRIRCWPGCHSGSSNGKYPNRALKMKPIFPTSAASAHRPTPNPSE